MSENKGKSNVINIDLDYDKCLAFARQFIEEENYLAAVQNLNDAVRFAVKTKRPCVDAYLMYSFVYYQTENYDALSDVYYHFLLVTRENDEFILDGIERLIAEAFPQENFDEEPDDRDMRGFVNIEGLNERIAYVKARELARNKRYDEFYRSFETLYHDSGKYSADVVEFFASMHNSHMPKAMQNKFCNALKEVFHFSEFSDISIMRQLLLFKDAETVSYLTENSRELFSIYADDMDALTSLGTAFFACGKYSVADEYLTEALRLKPYDECLLWYLALLNYCMGDLEKGREYLNTYTNFFEVCGVPSIIYRLYMETNPEYCAYPYLPYGFVSDRLKQSVEFTSQGGSPFFKLLGDAFLTSDGSVSRYVLNDYMRVCGPDRFPDSKPRELMILDSLCSQRVDFWIKHDLLEELLLSSTFEGAFYVCNCDTLYVGNFKRAKGFTEPFDRVYATALAELPFLMENVPFSSQTMAVVVGKLQELLGNKYDFHMEKHVEQLKWLAIICYASKKHVIVNYPIYFEEKKIAIDAFFKKIKTEVANMFDI